MDNKLNLWRELIILIIFIGLSISNAFGQVEYPPIPQVQPVDEATKSKLLSAFGKVPLHFVANQGQLPEEVVYYAKSEGATIYCTEQGLIFGFAQGQISLKFSENRRVRPKARGELKGKVNYFIGNDPTLWQTDISTFKEVVYPQVYPGIDLVYIGNQRRLKYTFYLQPHADPKQIQMIYDGIESLCVDDATGELVIQTPWGEMRDMAPVAYQEIEGVRKKVDISFHLIGEKRVGFAVGNYDPNSILTLDPGYSTYLGGSSGDRGYGITVDSEGKAYVTGYTHSSNFPIQNPYQGSYGGNNDVFVTKLSSNGDTLIYSTYLGGSEGDYGQGIAVDISGNAYVTGWTVSSDFPTKNSFQGSNAGGYDTFVTKLSSDGNLLEYSTYIGGSSNDYGQGIAVNISGNAYVTGWTDSSDFPTKKPFRNYFGWEDAFVTKLSSSGSTLIYSTYLGGSDWDEGYGIAVDISGNAYVTGWTDSSDFPTKKPFQGSNAGGYDTFVTKLSSDGNLLEYSTYIGGSGGEGGRGIVVDSWGNAYVTGWTGSSNFPTQNPFQGSHGGYYDCFVTKLSSSGNALVYSTYIGGSDEDQGWGIAVDSLGNAYVTGYTDSSDFPTENPFRGSYGGRWDAFVTKFSSSGSTLIYSTYLGGTTTDEGYGIAADSWGNAYVTGRTDSSDFPTENPFQGNQAGYDDAFVTSFWWDGSLGEPKTIYVSTTGNDGNDGLSWETAKQTIQAGIDAVSDGYTVLVKYGTYSITSSIDYSGKNIKLASDDGTHSSYEYAETDALQCIIDAGGNCRVFYFHNSETSKSVVHGFTIQNGKGTGANYGGGIYCYNNSSPTITHNIITSNSADSYGGGIGCAGSSPIITNNTIICNAANYGGGIYCNYSSSTITNNTIARNSAQYYGAGIYCYSSYDKIINNTITGNRANYGGGIYCYYYSSPTITNTILWNDSYPEIYLYSSSITVIYSDIKGGWPGEGNIDADPIFVDEGRGDYHLSNCSPCIGAGTSEGAPSIDIEGNPRGTPPDIGAYENPLDEPGDCTPPTPNTIASIAAVSATQIDITSTEAQDETPPVFYRLDGQYYDGAAWGDGGGGVSDYDYSPTRPNPWSDTNLVENGWYHYRQQVKDSATPPNESAWSDWVEKATLLNPPEDAEITFANITETGMDVKVAIPPKSSGAGETGAYFDIITGEGQGSGATDRDYADDYTAEYTNLNPDTQYGWKVKYRNHDGVKTAYNPTEQKKYTLANTPSAPTVSNPTPTTLDVTIEPNGNPDYTLFAIYNVTDSYYVNAGGGSSGDTEVWQTESDWGTVTVVNLTPETTYEFQCKAKNDDAIETPFGSSGSGTTKAPPVLKILPESLTIRVGETTTISIQIEDITDLGGFDFKLKYKTEIIELLSVNYGEFLTKTGRDVIETEPNFSTESEYTILFYGAATYGDQPPPSGTGDLATIELKGIGAGTTTLDLFDVQAGDAEANPISADVTDSSVTVSEPEPPTVASATPNALGQGASNQDVVITGTNFQSGASVTFSNTGITVHSTQIDSSTQITVNVSVATDAPTGSGDITVTNPDFQSGKGTDIFTVNPAPVITTLSPAQLPQGATNEDVTIQGDNFQDGASASFSGTGITVNSTTFVSATEITANVSIEVTAELGDHDVTVTNPDYGVGAKTDAFTVITLLVVNAGEDKTICHPNNGGEVQIGGDPTASGGTPPYTYNWAPADSLDDASVANPTATPTTTTTYTVTVTDSSNPQQEVSDIVTVTVYPELIADAGEDPPPINLGDTVPIGGGPTASGGTAPYTYSWQPADTLDNPTSSNPNATPTETTTYTVTVTDAHECVDTDDVTVTVVVSIPDVITLGEAEGMPGDEVRIPLYIQDVSGTPLDSDDPGNEIAAWTIQFSDDNEYYQITDVERAGITAEFEPSLEQFHDGNNTWTVIYNTSAGNPPPGFTLDKPEPGDLIGELVVTIVYE